MFLLSFFVFLIHHVNLTIRPKGFTFVVSHLAFHGLLEDSANHFVVQRFDAKWFFMWHMCFLHIKLARRYLNPQVQKRGEYGSPRFEVDCFVFDFGCVGCGHVYSVLGSGTSDCVIEF